MITCASRLDAQPPDSAHAHWPLIKDRHKVAQRGARKHVATIHQRKAPQMIATPRGLVLDSVKLRVRFAAQVLRQGRVCRVKNAFENASFGWNDSRHLMDYRRHDTPD
jgi:hypothetical protein